MDKFLKEIHVSVFYQWIINKNDYPWVVNNQELIYDHKLYTAKIAFNTLSIIELEIFHKEKDDIVFYLHFQMNNFVHALNLYYEFIDALNKVETNTTLKILLSCTGGLTTSLFAMQLNEACKTLSLDYHFDAVAYTELLSKGNDYDIILLAPQISFKHSEVQSALRHKLIIDIKPQVFASYNVADMLAQIREQRKAYRYRDKSPIDVPIKKNIPSDKIILAICTVRHSDSVRIGYRIYDHGKITLNKEILKQKLSMDDIKDVINTIISQYKIDKIAIAIPGILNNVNVRYVDSGVDTLSFKQLLVNDFNIPVYIINDANAMAIGHYVTLNSDENITFYFQPRGNTHAGSGNIINGKIYHGYKNMSGEVQFAQEEGNAFYSPKTEEEAIKLVAFGLYTIIGTIAPSKIIFYCEMIPNQQKLIDYLSQRINKEFLPEIQKTVHLKDYMLTGAMVYASEHK